MPIIYKTVRNPISKEDAPRFQEVVAKLGAEDFHFTAIAGIVSLFSKEIPSPEEVYGTTDVEIEKRETPVCGLCINLDDTGYCVVKKYDVHELSPATMCDRYETTGES